MIIATVLAGILDCYKLQRWQTISSKTGKAARGKIARNFYEYTTYHARNTDFVYMLYYNYQFCTVLRVVANFFTRCAIFCEQFSFSKSHHFFFFVSRKFTRRPTQMCKYIFAYIHAHVRCVYTAHDTYALRLYTHTEWATASARDGRRTYTTPYYILMFIYYFVTHYRS